jgi:hypothetical protein
LIGANSRSLTQTGDSMKKILTVGAAALALAAAPMAHAAAPLRTSAPMQGESELSGGIPLSAIIVLLAILGGAIYLAVDDEGSPDSP